MWKVIKAKAERPRLVSEVPRAARREVARHRAAEGDAHGQVTIGQVERLDYRGEEGHMNVLEGCAADMLRRELLTDGARELKERELDAKELGIERGQLRRHLCTGGDRAAHRRLDLCVAPALVCAAGRLGAACGRVHCLL